MEVIPFKLGVRLELLGGPSGTLESKALSWLNQTEVLISN
jgi:hypothetical protein